MTNGQTLPWPQRIGYGTFLLLVGVGVVVFGILVWELSPRSWTRYAIALQLAALLITFLLLRSRLTSRLVIYPLFVLCVLYLWDPTLPPPNIPEGLVRQLLARLFLVGLVTDTVWLLLQKRRTPPSPRATRSHVIRLSSVARIRKTTMPALRQQLRQVGWIVTITIDGEEYIPLEALIALLEREDARGE